MIKQTLIAPLLLSAGLSGQAPAPTRTPQPVTATNDELVTEVRGLRADIRRMTDTTLRAQLLVARLQVQEQRVAGIARQLAEADEQLRKLEGARNPFLERMLKDFDTGKPADPGEAEFMAGLKAQLERVQNGDPELKDRQAALTRLLADEQARWVEFNAQLEALERRIADPR
jgi:uncharacterized protein involved in exopolysaccharide biosynthesis